VIAKGLQRAASTVSRKVARHGGRPQYRANEADQQAWDSALRPARCLLAMHPRLREIVASKLILDPSPEEFSVGSRGSIPMTSLHFRQFDGKLRLLRGRLFQAGVKSRRPFDLLHSEIGIEVNADANLTYYWPIRLNVNDPGRKTILSRWLPADVFGKFDEYVHQLAHFWRDIRKKAGSQHGYIYCLALMFGTDLRSVTKPHRNLKVYAWKETAFRLAQVPSGLPTEGGHYAGIAHFGKLTRC
jgi:hypothetical protein